MISCKSVTDKTDGDTVYFIARYNLGCVAITMSGMYAENVIGGKMEQEGVKENTHVNVARSTER